jgi:hypothetical protein
MEVTRRWVEKDGENDTAVFVFPLTPLSLSCEALEYRIVTYRAVNHFTRDA